MLQINVIREKAAEAEAIVKAITTDVQRLDVAKKNLTGTIQTLERWGMLSGWGTLNVAIQLMVAVENAHQRLRELLPTRQYREMSSALSVSWHHRLYRMK
jgi:hypothetical protein